MIGKGVDMSNKNQNDILLSALEIVIDGVANSEATERTRAAGAYIAGRSEERRVGKECC